MTRLLLAVLISIGLIGCTTMKAVERPTPSTPNQVAVGDDVRVTTKVGKTYALKVMSVSETSMAGRDPAGKLWRVPFDQIQSLEVEQISGWKTAGATVAIVLAAMAALLVIALRNLDDEIQDEIENSFP